MVAEGLNWTRVTDWAQVSDCGRYSVSACKVMGVFKFEAWYRAKGKEQNLGIFEESAQGRRVCENHAAKQETAA